MEGSHAIESTVRALYECISGPAGVERDWDRFASLLFPGARLMRTTIGPDGSPQVKVMTFEEFREDTSVYFRLNPFHEAEVACRIERFGNIAHVFSTYESRHNAEDAQPFKRGINSIQLFFDGSRWLVMSVLWDNEREGLEVPEIYL